MKPQRQTRSNTQGEKLSLAASVKPPAASGRKLKAPTQQRKFPKPINSIEIYASLLAVDSAAAQMIENIHKLKKARLIRAKQAGDMLP